MQWNYAGRHARCPQQRRAPGNVYAQSSKGMRIVSQLPLRLLLHLCICNENVLMVQMVCLSRFPALRSLKLTQQVSLGCRASSGSFI